MNSRSASRRLLLSLTAAATAAIVAFVLGLVADFFALPLFALTAGVLAVLIAVRDYAPRTDYAPATESAEIIALPIAASAAPDPARLAA